MKKLFNLTVMVAIMAAMFSSCSKDNFDNENPGVNPAGEEAYFSFKLSQPYSTDATRATEVGTDSEQRVNDVAILLYDNTGADAILRYVFELDATNYGSGIMGFTGDNVATGSTVDPTAVNQIGRFVSTAEHVRYQDYQMIVLVNYKNVDAITNAMRKDVSTLSQINTVIENEDVDTYNNDSFGFFMSNANGVVPVSASQLKPSPEEAEGSPVPVSVDRLLAKVRIYTDFPDTYTEELGGTFVTPSGLIIRNVTASLNITNKSTYLIRQYAYYAPVAAGGSGAMETYATSINTDRAYIYATDFNFSGMRNASAAQLANHFTKIDQSSTFNSIAKYTTANIADGEYVFENTMELADQAHIDYLNYTTHYFVRAFLTPKGFATGSSYYSFTNSQGKNMAFTHDDALEWIEYGSYPDGMEEIADRFEIINDNDYQGDLDFTTGSTYPTGWTEDMLELLTEEGITYHPGGLNIYVIPIKHFLPTGTMVDPRNDLYGHYGIVRNNVYNVRITSIDGPGTGTTNYISTDITINEWYVRDQGEDI